MKFITISSTILGIMLCLTAIINISCSGNKTEEDKKWIDSDSASTIAAITKPSEVVPEGADILFDDFFFNFAGNRSFQLKRIDSTLKKSWKYDSFFMGDGFYTLIMSSLDEMKFVKDTTVTKAVVKRIHLKERDVEDFVFKRYKGDWYLTAVNKCRISDSPNSSFLYFYYRFANDPKFQLMCLHNPLTFIGPDPDNDFESIEGSIAPETWPAFCPALLPKDVLYNIVYGNEKNIDTNTTIFVIRGIANGMEIRMTFGKEHGVWTLQRYEQ